MLNRLARHRQALWAILFPLACLWAVVTRYRRSFWRSRERYRSALPVICIGNLHSGGSGKTPLVLAIAQKFSKRRPAVLSRGYRAQKMKCPTLVDARASDGPSRYGDEPWMIAKRLSCPVWIGADRKAGLRAIEQSKNADLIILDDGFQHLAIAADCNIIVIGTDRKVEDSYCLPLGELREPWSALRDAQAVVLSRGEDPQNENAWKTFIAESFPRLPFFSARRHWEPISAGMESLPALARFGAFCGIASPHRFAADLSHSVGGPVFLLTFEDHHFYREVDITRILAEKKRTGATHLITTEKDRAKAEGLFLARGEKLWVARIRHELSEQFWSFLSDRLEKR